jgi:hypothetical protein
VAGVGVAKLAGQQLPHAQRQEQLQGLKANENDVTIEAIG